MAQPVRGGSVQACCAVAVALLVTPAAARAAPVELGALSLRLDGTLRYNLGLRTDPVDARLGATPAFTAGEWSVERGHLSTHRLDLLLELDAALGERVGLRASGAGWYDDAYRSGEVSRSPALVAAGVPGTYLDDELSTATLRRHRGPYAEVLDAFAWARLDAGPVPVAVKAGRHTVTWGESLMLGGAIHGIAYAQAPLDLQKGFATPGVEAKELFRPLAAVSAQAQLMPSLSVAAQAFLEWQPSLYPEGGTFLGAGDAGFSGPDGTFRTVGGNPAFLPNDGVHWASDRGEWGVALRWAPEPLRGTLGLHYRRATDKLAGVFVTANPGGVGPLSPAVPSPFRYGQYFGERLDLVGVSFARQVLGASVGAEVVWRHHAPLVAQNPAFAVAPAPPLAAALFPHGAPRLVDGSYQARGDTLHGLLNAVGVLGAVPGVDTLAWAVEATWSRWLAVDENRDVFFAEGYGVCRADPALAAAGLARRVRDGCATRQSFAVSAGLTPTWFRVASGVDLSAPVSASWTIDGNSPVAFGGNEGSGTFGGGLAVDVRGRFRVELRYSDFFGRLRDDGATVTSANGQLAILRNRGSVTLTAKATF